jgi:hypothetical protein
MKLLFQIVILTIMFALPACNVYTQRSPQRTSSARAAYGNAVPEFKANKKKNQKRKKKALKETKRKKARNSRSPWHGRPY